MRMVSYGIFLCSSVSQARSEYGHHPCLSRKRVGWMLLYVGLLGSRAESIDLVVGGVCKHGSRPERSAHDGVAAENRAVS